ncbi:MAG: c-type cytochrome [Gemmatimonadaceae bacterium]
MPSTDPGQDDAAAGGGGPRRGDGGVPEVGGVDLQPDVERLHGAIRREPHDPVEGRERVPWFLVAVIPVALFWGGWYLGSYGGEFGTGSHLAFATRQPAIAAAAADQSAAAVADPVAAGEAVYVKNCQVCHQAQGQGMAGAFPPLVESEWVTGSPVTVVRILMHGLQGPLTVAGASYNGAMPAWEGVLKDAEIAAVATYIRQMEGNDAPAVPPETVDAARTVDGARTAPWTAAELEQAPPVEVPGVAAPSPAAGAGPAAPAPSPPAPAAATPSGGPP